MHCIVLKHTKVVVEYGILCDTVSKSVCRYWLKCVFMDKRSQEFFKHGEEHVRELSAASSLTAECFLKTKMTAAIFCPCNTTIWCFKSTWNAPWKSCSSFCGRQWITAIIFSLLHTHTHTLRSFTCIPLVFGVLQAKQYSCHRYFIE